MLKILRQKKILPLLFFLFLAPFPALAFHGKVVKVLDGDTIDVLHNGKAERVRLHGIDAPEIF